MKYKQLVYASHARTCFALRAYFVCNLVQCPQDQARIAPSEKFVEEPGCDLRHHSSELRQFTCHVYLFCSQQRWRIVHPLKSNLLGILVPLYPLSRLALLPLFLHPRYLGAFVFIFVPLYSRLCSKHGTSVSVRGFVPASDSC